MLKGLFKKRTKQTAQIGGKLGTEDMLAVLGTEKRAALHSAGIYASSDAYRVSSQVLEGYISEIKENLFQALEWRRKMETSEDRKEEFRGKKNDCIRAAKIYDESPMRGMDSQRLEKQITANVLPNLNKALRCQKEIEELKASLKTPQQESSNA